MEEKTMEDLFRSYWWLLFPLAWFVSAGFSGLMSYRRHRDTLNLIKAYVDKGQEPPPALLTLLERSAAPEDIFADGGMAPVGQARSGATNYWSLFGLFTMLAAGFLGAGYYLNLDGGSGAFTIVGFTMAAVAFWALINAVFRSRNRDR
tara:strand:- start:181 stop:624 length:444 start_codon:yes stop_codon:yes gene_type:complete